MTQDSRVRAHRRASLVADLIMATTVALVVFVLLAPTSRATSPGQCVSTFAYGVPCGWALPVTASIVAAVVTAVVLTMVHRRQWR